MACAGYLALENARVVFVEVINGVLVCKPTQRPSLTLLEDVDTVVSKPKEIQESRPTERLPLLTKKWLKTRESSFDSQHKLRDPWYEEPESEDEALTASTVSDDGSVSEQEQNGERVVKLSGYVVEVEAKETEFDMNSLPFTFRVQTSRLILHEDLSHTLIPADSIKLSAPDQESKDLWVRRLKQWKRYAWRETTLLRASEEDASLLDEAISQWNRSSSFASGDTCLLQYASSRPSKSRRRYNRASAPSAFPELTGTDTNAWFNTRVVKTHQ
ncbi:hypothetical protein Poli38472_007430 [Pythium oligandrum]|uniref:Uncharacterized protein n=1 Tax=Pythium oligandrum TaxID=41045 RepID=A0A8K1CRQ8_PYTOL|nr:hypothetical protein Poli38472_007430 [Pythium oligandrum]|eukprot:TMW67758.1 hypothetical protein Poli38472_007430 [Pythium oligandrum]